jgi:hypothetical protein
MSRTTTADADETRRGGGNGRSGGIVNVAKGGREGHLSSEAGGLTF